MMRRTIPKYLFAVLALLVAPLALGQVSEYAVKAAYLLNFVKFVSWPDKVYDNENGAIEIGILGDDPFGDTLDDMAKGKVINGHSIIIWRFESFDEGQAEKLRQCHILFICYSEKNRLPGILRTLKGAPVLTVSEIEKFPLLGGMILFDQEGQRITLGINPKTAQKAKLEIDSKLLQISKIYKSE